MIVRFQNFQQMAQEISIHRGLSHKHIVKFVSYFEDDDNVYILLELCAKRVCSTNVSFPEIFVFISTEISSL